MPSYFKAQASKAPRRLRPNKKSQRDEEMWQELEMDRERAASVRGWAEDQRKRVRDGVRAAPSVRPPKIKAKTKDKDWRKYGTLTLKLAPAEIAKIKKQLCI